MTVSEYDKDHYRAGKDEMGSWSELFRLLRRLSFPGCQPDTTDQDDEPNGGPELLLPTKPDLGLITQADYISTNRYRRNYYSDEN